MKKIIIFKLIPILLLIFIYPYISYADDESIEENVSCFEEIKNTSTDINSIPTINARYACVYDRASGTLLYDKNSSKKTKMASTTKIMTAIIVIENSNLKDPVTISKKSAGTGGSRLGLSTNDTITVENLLYGLLMCSGNDAAVALAEHVGGSIENFAKMMNTKVSELNLSSTHFVTPHGLDNDEHYTTAFELAKITNYALNNETFSKIVNTKTYTITINNSFKTLSNTNELLGNLNGIYGVKTGFTNGANRCLVTACKRENLDIICIVLGCDTKKDRTKDSIKLIEYTFSNFTTTNIEKKIDANFKDWYKNSKNSFIINKGISNNLNLSINKDQIPYNHLAINNNDINNICISIYFNSYYEAPLIQNTKIGTLIFKINDIEYFSIDIINENTINKKNIFNYLYSFLYNYQTLLKNYSL